MTAPTAIPLCLFLYSVLVVVVVVVSRSLAVVFVVFYHHHHHHHKTRAGVGVGAVLNAAERTFISLTVVWFGFGVYNNQISSYIFKF